jgi:hypothetical protein
VLFAVAIARAVHIQSPGDATGVTLSPARVRAGMLIGLTGALLLLPYGNSGFETAACLWATLAGAGLQALNRPRIFIFPPDPPIPRPCTGG